MSGKTYNLGWVTFMLLGTVVVLYFSPGSSFSAVPIYFSQAYLFCVVNLGTSKNDKRQLRSAVAVSVFCAIAAVLGALAATYGVLSTYDIIIANVHLGIVLSVSLVIAASCAHMWDSAKLGVMERS